MVIYRLLLGLLVMASAGAHAQIRVQADNPGVDTLEIVFHNDKWTIPHTIAGDETIFMLSRKYHVPPALIADVNGIDFQTPLQNGTIVFVPYGPFNKAKSVSGRRSDVRPLYYMVRKYDNLYRLSHLADVQQKKMQQWNGLTDNYIEEGQRLFVGWVLFEENVKNMPKQNVVVNPKGNEQLSEKDYTNEDQDVITKRNGNQVVIIKKNYYDTLPEVHKKYNSQTKDELVTTEEKGTAVFYENKGKLSNPEYYFAFHNEAAPGTIIKVYNPGTDKMVFVKVLGKIPNAKLYHNALIGISDGAKEALLVTEGKAWVELKYAP